MTGTEKKIAEVIDLSKPVSDCPECGGLGEIRSLGSRRKCECLYIRVKTLKRELDRRDEENRKLREENEGRKKIIEAYMRIEHDLAEDAERYLQQRDKLIEGLRKLAKTNAENISEIREWKAKQNDPEVTDLDWYNYVARDILKEIGVTAE